jgi:valyl-tRNA synthetase
MARVCIYAHGKAKEKLIKENVGLITNLAKLENLRLLDSTKKPKDTLSTFVEDLDIFLEFGGLIDREKEKQRIEKELQNAADRKAAKEKLLKNAEFIKKAPSELVDKTRQEKTDLRVKIERLEKLLTELG